MGKAFLALAIWLTLLASIFAGGQNAKVDQFGHVKATRTYQPARQLDFEVQVPATVSQVWNALSTADGLVSWLGPEASVQLREGGDWIVRFPGSSAGGGTILSFVPNRRLELAAMAPEAFPNVRKERTKAVFEIKEGGPVTVVQLTQTGWKDGDEWDRAFEYLAKGNCQLLNALYYRFVNGPTDWKPILDRLPK
jgi:uncharacterized protein YndB with AHSA1/START domain